MKNTAMDPENPTNDLRDGHATIGRISRVNHWMTAVAMSRLLALHIGAALKHHLIDRDATLSRRTGHTG